MNENVLSEMAGKDLFFNYADCKETICKITFSYTKPKDADPVINEALVVDRDMFLTTKLLENNQGDLDLELYSNIDLNNGTWDFYLAKPKKP